MYLADVVYLVLIPRRVAGTCAGAWMVPVVVLARCRPAWVPETFAVPLSPLFPALAILTNTFLVFSLGVAAYVRFAVWVVVSCAVYVAYGVHHTMEDAELVVDMEMAEQQGSQQETHAHAQQEADNNASASDRATVPHDQHAKHNGSGNHAIFEIDDGRDEERNVLTAAQTRYPS